MYVQPQDRASALRYVALGDSFSEGVGDEAGLSLPGWTGRVAAALAAHSHQQVLYANLAVRGRLLARIVGEQLPAALALHPLPTVVSLCPGGNNMLRPRFVINELLALVERAALALEACGAQLFLLTPANPSDHLPLGGVVRRRGEAWADALQLFAQDRSLPFIDVSRDAELSHPRYWARDRLHLNADGYQRVAELVLHVIADGAQAQRPPWSAATSRTLAMQAAYYREFVTPWVIRRLTGRSSGDGRSASHPLWTVVPPPL